MIEIRTAQEFINAFSSPLSNSYSIVNDIDFEAAGLGYRTQPFYFQGQAGTIITCTIDGNGHTIKNLTIESNRCFVGPDSNRNHKITLQNLKIENLFFKPTALDNDNYIFFSYIGNYSESGYLKLNNISLSASQVAIINGNDIKVKVNYGGNNYSIENCSFYLKNFNFKENTFNGGDFKNNNILLENCKLITDFITAYSTTPIVRNMGIILKNCEATNSSLMIFHTPSNNISYCYIALDESFQFPAGTANVSCYYGASANNNILSYNDEVLGGRAADITFSDFTGTKLSKSQMQSKEYLQQIGWLP